VRTVVQPVRAGGAVRKSHNFDRRQRIAPAEAAQDSENALSRQFFTIV
jgi:hypothetical protein